MRVLVLALALALPVAAQESTPLAVHTVAVGGGEMAYRDVGSGPPLVLLHGFGSCAESQWAPFLDTLAARHRVIAVDLRAHGRSTHPATTFTMAASGADVLALLDALGLARVRAMGVSAGGMTLLHAAGVAPERFERLVVVGVGTHFPDETRAWVRETTLETLPPEIAAEFRACVGGDEARAARLAARFAALADDAGPAPLAPRDLAGVTVPTLFVEGDRDVFFPVDQIAALYLSHPDARLWVVPDGDHVPLYDPATPVVATAEAFLAGAVAP